MPPLTSSEYIKKEREREIKKQPDIESIRTLAKQVVTNIPKASGFPYAKQNKIKRDQKHFIR